MSNKNSNKNNSNKPEHIVPAADKVANLRYEEHAGHGGVKELKRAQLIATLRQIERNMDK